jgi:hypothetical protein
MLDEAGFKPEFVLVSSACPVVPELRDRWMSAPQGSTFDTVLVRAKIDGQFVYFNDTDQYARLGSTPYDGHTGLTCDGRLVTVEALPDQLNGTTSLVEAKIAPDGDATIKVTTQYRGMNYAEFHKQMAEQTPEDRRRFAQEMIAMISQAAQLQGEFAVNDKDYPATLSFTVRVPRFAVRDGKFLYFNLPGQQAGQRLPGAAAERRNPYYAEDKGSFENSYVFDLPPGELAVVPASFDLPAPADLAHVTLKVDGSTAPNRVKFDLNFSLKPALVPAHRYDELKAWNARVRHPSNQAFMLKLAE